MLKMATRNLAKVAYLAITYKIEAIEEISTNARAECFENIQP